MPVWRPRTAASSTATTVQAVLLRRERLGPIVANQCVVGLARPTPVGAVRGPQRTPRQGSGRLRAVGGRALAGERRPGAHPDPCGGAEGSAESARSDDSAG